MSDYRLGARVAARIRALLIDGEDRFGPLARDRYAALILQAIRDVAEEPDRSSARRVPFADRKARLYHLRHSRERVPDPPGRVGDPRHILVYEIGADGIVNILGLIPDRVPMEVALPRLLPDL